MMEEALVKLGEMVWGPVMIFLLVGTGLYLNYPIGPDKRAVQNKRPVRNAG